MHKYQNYLSTLFFIILFASCSTSKKIEALKPEPDNASPLKYENTTSFISLPISVKLKDIENQINVALNGLIYEDKNIEDDNCTVKIWKLSPISLSNENGKLKTLLPLKAEVNYRIGTNKLGVNLYTTRTFNFNGTVNLLSTINLTNWKLNTKTELKSLDWKESPSVSVMGKSMPITYLINPTIKIFKSDIEKSIDDAINQSIDLKPNVLDALEKMSQPIELSAEYQSWLQIVPIELYSTNSKLQKGDITFEMGLKCYISSLIGQKPVSKFDKSKIVLKPVSKLPKDITANVVAISTYQDASKMIAKNFSGQEFTSGKNKVSVQNVEIWHKEGKMIIALDLIGSINGIVYLSGIPTFNAQTKEIYFDQLDYVLDTKNKLMRSANWIAQGYILKKIEENCRYSIQPNLDEGKQNILKYLNNYSPMPGVFVNGTINSFDFDKIQLTNKAIIAFLKLNGEIKVTVDGMK